MILNGSQESDTVQKEKKKILKNNFSTIFTKMAKNRIQELDIHLVTLIVWKYYS